MGVTTNQEQMVVKPSASGPDPADLRTTCGLQYVRLGPRTKSPFAVRTWSPLQFLFYPGQEPTVSWKLGIENVLFSAVLIPSCARSSRRPVTLYLGRCASEGNRRREQVPSISECPVRRGFVDVLHYSLAQAHSHKCGCLDDWAGEFSEELQF
jgi:hypothetical protein